MAEVDGREVGLLVRGAVAWTRVNSSLLSMMSEVLFLLGWPGIVRGVEKCEVKSGKTYF